MIINKNNNGKLSKLSIVYYGSTMLEDEKTYGMSHYGEHIMCKAFEDYIELFDQDCIDWNAHTSDSYVEFYISGLDEDILKYRELFINSLYNYIPTKEDFEDERNILLAEYDDYYASQESAHLHNLSRSLDNYYCVLGDKNVLENCTYEEYLVLHNKLYDKPSKIISISSIPLEMDIEFKDEIEIKYEKNENNISNYSNFNSDMTKSVIVNGDLFGVEDTPYINFIGEMLCGSLKSPLYALMREDNGYTYGIMYLDLTLLDKTRFTISYKTDNKLLDESIQTIKEFFQNYKIEEHKNRFNVVKENLIKYYKKIDIIGSNTNTHDDVALDKSMKTILNDVTHEKIIEIYNKHFSNITYSIFDGDLIFV